MIAPSPQGGPSQPAAAFRILTIVTESTTFMRSSRTEAAAARRSACGCGPGAGAAARRLRVLKPTIQESAADDCSDIVDSQGLDQVNVEAGLDGTTLVLLLPVTGHGD